MFGAVGLGPGGSGKLLQQNSQKNPSSSSSGVVPVRPEVELLSLPPNVNGRRRGTLEVRLSGIRWTKGKSYPLVEIQLLWWGQGQQQRGRSLLHWKQGKNNGSESERLVLRYEVLTSEELFRKYLKAAEPIQVRLVSSRTGSLIGTAAVPIPGKLVSFRVGEEVEVVGRADIVSGTGFGLGDLSLEFFLRFDKPQQREDKENGKGANMVQKVKKSLPVVLPEKGLELAVKGVSASLHEGRKQAKTFRSLDNPSRSNVLNYLSGKLLSGSEDEALSEICSISPAESMMDALHKFDAAPAPKKTEYLNAVDSARMLVENLKFTKAGLKEIIHKTKLVSLAEMGFLIKVKLPTQSGAGSKIKFASVSVSDCGEATFNGKAMTKIVVPKKPEDFRFEFQVFLTLGPVFHQRSTTGRQIFLGSSVIKLEELVSSRFTCYKRCPVRLASDDILLGMLTVRVELGARGLHFGTELIDALLLDKENVSISSSSSESDLQAPPPCWSFKPLQKCSTVPMGHSHFRCKPITCSQDQQSAAPNTSKDLSPTQDSSAPTRSRSNPSQPQESSQESGPKAMDVQEDHADNSNNLLHGVLHLGQLKDVPTLTTGGYFLVAHGFWSDEDNPVLTTELSQDRKSFNYLITFPVLPNARFLERTKNQHMPVELWQKTPDAAEKLVGVTRLPLHQFYIAFRDAQLADHLSRAKLPVISIDGWSGIGSPLASEPCGQVQAVLAIGTENQIEYFKLSRGLTHTSGDAPMPSNRPAVPEADRRSPQTPKKSSNGPDAPPLQTMVTPSTAIAHQRNFESYQPINSSNTGKQQSEVANMLSAFIENLAQRLPISSERSTAPCYDQNFADNRQATPPPQQRPPFSLLASPHSQANHPQMRKTSDLLENLQRALAQRPPENVSSDLLTAPPVTAPSEDNQPPPLKQPSGPEEKLFKVSIEIEQAVNLPKVNVGKKYGKRNKNRPQGSSQQRVEVEPSAYVTFEGYNLQPGMGDTVKSHEGIVYTTAIVEGSSNPNWKKKFDVRLPVDLMTNDEKRFILKVWRKAVVHNTNQGGAAKGSMVPAPMEDAVVGFTAVDLSVFLNGMPCILGWYNIMDFSGRCNGQIKVNIQPQENVTIYKGLEEGVNFQIPLSIDVDCGGGLDAENASLSRALKRKFTELEEITQRLRARLFDVTGDENVDPDDEFERDLNTEADEEDDDEWVDPLEDSSGQKRNSQFPNGAGTGQQTRTTNTCSYTMSSDHHRVSDRSLTGCSDRSTQQTTQGSDTDQRNLLLEKLIKEHNLDTLINPHILKNLINPVMSTSESTPMTNPYANIPSSESSGATSADTDMSEESAEGGGSSSDKVKLISSALQRATISDGGDDGTPPANASTEPSSSGQDSTEPRNKREAPEGEPMKVNDK